MKIALCGIKHSGKTTLGRLIAARWRVPFRDSDAELEKREGCPVRELYARLGAEEFRRREAALLRKLARSRQSQILALGGGALENPFFPEADRKKLGLLIWIDVPDQTAFERMLCEGLPPFLSGSPDPYAEFCRMNAARKKTFERCADLTCRPSGDLPELTVDSLLCSICMREDMLS